MTSQLREAEFERGVDRLNRIIAKHVRRDRRLRKLLRGRRRQQMWWVLRNLFLLMVVLPCLRLRLVAVRLWQL